jgi:hypothetical protein
MKVTTYEGIVENGQVRLPQNIRLPEKARVYVVIPDADVTPTAYIGSPRLRRPEQAVDFVKEVIKEKNDASL